jgi:glycosyltransferase involved in cell wall biosynthesis
VLLPPGRKDLLLAAVDRLVSEPDWKAALIAGGRRTLQKRFRWETLVAETEAVLKNAVLKKGASR